MNFQPIGLFCHLVSFLGCGETSKAADILARKNEPKLLSAASHIAMRFGDHQQALTYAHRGIMKSLADADYENAKVLIDLNPDLKVMFLFICCKTSPIRFLK